jgi:hypothetical protein
MVAWELLIRRSWKTPSKVAAPSNGQLATLKISLKKAVAIDPSATNQVFDPDVIMGIGIHGQMLYVDRPRGVVVAKQSSWPNPDSEEMHLDAFNACRAIAHALG